MAGTGLPELAATVDETLVTAVVWVVDWVAVEVWDVVTACVVVVVTVAAGAPTAIGVPERTETGTEPQIPEVETDTSEAESHADPLQ